MVKSESKVYFDHFLAFFHLFCFEVSFYLSLLYKASAYATQLWSGLTGITTRLFFAKVIFVSVKFDMCGLFGQIAQLPAWKCFLTYDPLSSTSLHKTTIPPEKSVSSFILVFIL